MRRQQSAARRVAGVFLSLAVATGAGAQDLAAGLAKCAQVPDSLQRLVCYDALAKDYDTAYLLEVGRWVRSMTGYVEWAEIPTDFDGGTELAWKSIT